MQNKVKKYFLFLLLVCCRSFLTAQLPGMPAMALKEAKNVFGGADGEAAFSITNTSDGGYAVTGYTVSNNGDVSGSHGSGDIWIVKFNVKGFIEWQKTLGGTNFETGFSIIQTSDGGYAIAGETRSNNGDVSINKGKKDMWVVKLSSMGLIEWQKTLGGTENEEAKSIIQSSDGGYVVAGWTGSNNGDVSGNHGGSDMWVVKLNGTGTILWEKILGETKDDGAFSIIQTTDGGYAVAGYTGLAIGYNAVPSDMWVVKLNATGALEWQKTLGGSGNDEAHSIIQTGDGGYGMVGRTQSNNGDVSGNHGGFDIWVAKLNATGALEWQKTLGGSNNDDGRSIIRTVDGGYIMIGSTQSNDGDVSGNHGGFDIWVAKLNATGALEWQKTVGGTGYDEAYAATQMSNQVMTNGFIVAGTTASGNGDIAGPWNGNQEFFLPRLDASGNVIRLYEDVP
ncbi:T9SS C-terminal target domain-containing protein [uncultured Chryseobacterium sp.]|uniref:T9SS C-terminal target domain-containing protein n=1 Tax=uncultured Chryseobacterium sp. TaxID=259322 RepID=UPI0025EC3AA9|nr:T9SS C-terminal target domain-containing protein [uncultured Chryseobacterium sp.]